MSDEMFYLVCINGAHGMTGDRGVIVASGTLEMMREELRKTERNNPWNLYDIFVGGQEETRLIGGSRVR